MPEPDFDSANSHDISHGNELPTELYPNVVWQEINGKLIGKVSDTERWEISEIIKTTPASKRSSYRLTLIVEQPHGLFMRQANARDKAELLHRELIESKRKDAAAKQEQDDIAFGVTAAELANRVSELKKIIKGNAEGDSSAE